MKMHEMKTLECQDCVQFYPYVPQEMRPKTNNIGEQNFNHIQISSYMKVYDGFAIDQHMILFFNLDEMISQKKNIKQ